MKEICLLITSLFVMMLGIWWMLMLSVKCLGEFWNVLIFPLYEVLFGMKSLLYYIAINYGFSDIMLPLEEPKDQPLEKFQILLGLAM